MSNQPDIRRYRIGDFARHMGVTPDFLKHYEEHGLVQATHTEAGYRYYDFRQSARILEYMRLKNCGISIKEMKGMLSLKKEDALALMDERLDEIRLRMTFEAAVLEEHERFRKWYTRRQLHPIEWEVREIDGWYFLPHADTQDFIQDERIQDILKRWVSWMPVVKSCMMIDPGTRSGAAPLHTVWGLVVRASDAKRFGIPTNSVVSEIAPCRAFVYHFAGDAETVSRARVSDPEHPLYARVRELGLRPTGKICFIVDMTFADESGTQQNCFGRFLVPVE